MNTINILIVEDEAIVALDIKRTVQKMGYGVSGMVSSYDGALQSIQEQMPDIILLDIHLHNSQDGIEIAYSVHQQSPIPIIFLTAFADDKTIQRAIATNPVGYLVKPFKRETLKSTLHLAVYRLQTTDTIKPHHHDLGHGYAYDIDNGQLFFKNYPIKLSHNEKQLLELLIKAQGNSIPFGVIEEHIWGSKLITKSSLRTLLYRLRSKIEYKLIETVPSFGVRLVKS